METQDFVAIDFETMTPELTSVCAIVHIPEHTRSLSGSLLGYKTIP